MRAAIVSLRSISHRKVSLFTWSFELLSQRLQTCLPLCRDARVRASASEIVQIWLHSVHPDSECFEPIAVGNASHEQIRRRSGNGIASAGRNVIESGPFLINKPLFVCRATTRAKTLRQAGNGSVASEFTRFDESARRVGRLEVRAHGRLPVP